MFTVTIAGTGASELQALLPGAAMHVSTAETEDLAGLAHPDADVPDVLVVDVRRDRRLPGALADIRHFHPLAGIVIVAPTLEPAFLLEALHAGANEVVAEPLTADTLRRAVMAVAERQPNGNGNQVFAFIGAKGGVGKTTLAVNVATALGPVAAPGRVLLIDAHAAGGDAAVFFGAHPAYSIEHAFNNTARLDDSMLHDLVTPVAPNVDLLAGCDQAVAPDVDPAKLRDVIDLASRRYRYTIVDLPRGDAGVLEALQRVNGIVVVVTQELGAVRSGARLVRLLRDTYGHDKVHVVLNRLDANSDIGPGDVARAINAPVEFAFPSDYRAAVRALEAARPLALDGHRGLPEAFHRFARQLSGAQPPGAARREGFFGRLTHAGA